MEKAITKYRTLCQISIKCACLANLSACFEACLAFAMERGEESPLSRVPSVDRVSARVRGSRPVGPPPLSNTFDVRQPLPIDGGATGTLHKFNSHA